MYPDQLVELTVVLALLFVVMIAFGGATKCAFLTIAFQRASAAGSDGFGGMP